MSPRQIVPPAVGVAGVNVTAVLALRQPPYAALGTRRWPFFSFDESRLRFSVIVQRGLRRLCAPLTTEGETISPSVPPPS